MKTDNWPKAGRIVHLLGGGRVENPIGDMAYFHPHTLSNKSAEIKLPSYGALFRGIKELGQTIVGVEFIQSESELTGEQPPEWRSYHKQSWTAWPAWELTQKWSQTSHAAFEEKEGQLWDIASRISHQLRIVSWRLKEISDAYHNQLMATHISKRFEKGNNFEDGYTQFMYMAIQSFLVDLCVLRDFLAEFAWKYEIKKHFAKNGRVDSMASLRRQLRSTMDTPPCSLAEQIIAVLEKNSWLDRLTAYRNLIVHSAPLAQSECRLFASCSSFPMSDGQEMPAIRCPIPDEPRNVKRMRDSGKQFASFEKQKEQFYMAATGKIPSTDALQYAHEVFGKTLSLTNDLVAYSPIAPKMRVFDSSNIIGPVTFTKQNRDGDAGR